MAEIVTSVACLDHMWTTVVSAVIVAGEPTHAVALVQQDVALEEHTDRVDVTLTIALATKSEKWVETDVPIALPEGGRIYALAIETQWQTFVSRGEPADRAREHFEAAHRLPMDALTGRPRDPALLEKTDAGFVLHVFPVAHDKPTKVRIYATVPRGEGGPLRRDWMSEDPTPRVTVDAETSLYAGPLVSLPQPSEPHVQHLHVAAVPEVHLERLADPLPRRHVPGEQLRVMLGGEDDAALGHRDPRVVGESVRRVEVARNVRAPGLVTAVVDDDDRRSPRLGREHGE